MLVACIILSRCASS